MYSLFKASTKREEPKKIFFLDDYYARIYHPDRPFQRSRLKFETLAPNQDGDGCGCGCMGVMALLFLIPALLISAAYVHDVLNKNRIEAEGISTEFTVTDCVMERVTKDTQDPTITVVYRVGDVEQRYTDTLNTLAECADFPPGKVLVGKYLSTGTDTVNVIFDDIVLEGTDWLVGVIGVVMVIVASVTAAEFIARVIGHRRALRQYRTLIKRGQILDGELIEVTKSMINDEYLLIVTYEFVTPDGRKRICQQRRKSLERIGQKLPHKGTPVKVLYAENHVCVML